MKTGLSELAKNLLLERTCHNCNHALTLADRDISPEVFEKLTGLSASSIHEGAYIDDVLFYCSKQNNILPVELSCQDWELEHE